LAAYVAARATYGDVVQLASSPTPLYLLSHPDAVQHVLRDQVQNYRKGIFFRNIAALQGEGLLTAEGEVWRQQRRIAQAALHRRHLERFGAIMAEEIQGVVQGWYEMAKSAKPLNVAAWMHRLTFRVVGRALLGVAPETLDALGLQLQEVAARLWPHLATPVMHRWRVLAWVPTPKRRQFRRAVADYNAIAQRLIETRRHALQHGTAPCEDLLATFIAACDAGEMTAQQVRDEVITFIGAGAETSANALSWTWYLLAQHPDVAERVHQEVATVLGGRRPTLADLSQMPYSRQVLDESLRLYPPAALLPRQANAADTLSGYTIPRHAVVLLSQYVTHRHPEFWPEPERFEPERFDAAQTAGRHRFAYFPFGEGPRVCIGKAFALQEMQLALVTLAQYFTLTLASTRPVIPVLLATLAPRDGIWMTVHARR
jgi:cytochrome P450